MEWANIDLLNIFFTDFKLHVGNFNLMALIHVMEI
jgi:hypothetical protein